MTFESSPEPTYFELINDDMFDYFDEDHYNASFKKAIRECLVKWEDDDFPEAIDAYWKEAIAYFNEHNKEDDWVDCFEEPENERCNFDPVADFYGNWREFKSKKGASCAVLSTKERIRRITASFLFLLRG